MGKTTRSRVFDKLGDDEIWNLFKRFLLARDREIGILVHDPKNWGAIRRARERTKRLRKELEEKLGSALGEVFDYVDEFLEEHPEKAKEKTTDVEEPPARRPGDHAEDNIMWA